MQNSSITTKNTVGYGTGITMRNHTSYICIVLIVLLCGFFPSDGTPRIFLVGDSTMADKPLVDNPERGWGQAFSAFFQSPVVIENHARNGRSTKSFINEGRWANVIERVREGDYVFIQFGHNDEKKEDTSRFADPKTDYRNNLLRFIRETRAKNATAVLLTPVSRRKFDAENRALETHAEYSEAVRAVAREQNVPLIDLDAKSMALLSQLGPDESKKLFLWIPPGRYRSLPDGREDNTHFSFAGAKKVAGLVADAIRELHLPLVSLMRSVDTASDAGKGKVVCLDYFYNNERKTMVNSRPSRYHYVWEDTANSGYSELGKTIINAGAEVDTLSVAPTTENLSHASMYVIVDPDTPAENLQPNYIGEKDITAIVAWVSSGGILLLFGNDKGNAEFEHFNTLAENFGIHFNEDSRNRVQGSDFETGAFANFPDHPLFKGVKKIYIKELATLKLAPPATSLLTDHGDVIMAYAKFGKGSVFAVGDPWFYNEYFDNRKLPEGFQNFKAAENLFQWLLKDAKVVRNND